MIKIILIKNFQLIFVFVIVIQSLSFAQDIIYKKSNDSIVCNIIDIKSSYISYKLFNSNDTATYEILLEDYEYFTKQKKSENEYSVNYKISNQQLRKGAYLTFQEYLNNSPSVIFEFEVITRSENNVKMWGGKKFKIISKDKNIYQSKIKYEFWGVCDGTDCYINGYPLNHHVNYSFLTRENECAFFYSIPSREDKKKIKMNHNSDAIAGAVVGGIIGGAVGGAIAGSQNTERFLYHLSYKTGKIEIYGK